MAREYARIVTAVWSDPEWRALSPEAQRMFLALLSQPKLTMVGSLDYKPERWAAQASGLTVGAVEAAIEELAAGERPFVFVDLETEELVIRTFVRHDGSAKNQKLRAPMWGAWRSIESPWLRRELLDHLPDEAWTEGRTGAPPPEAIQLRNTPFQRPGKTYSAHENRPRNTPHPQPHPQPEPNTPSSADADGAPDPFDEFWATCPRKVGKAEARRKWARATKATDPAVLIEAMRTHAAHWRAHRTEDRFIPHPATWLHQGRWLDELVSPSSNDPPEFHRSAVLERNEARARGEACELCAGTGWQPIDGTNDAEPCDCTRRETA